MTVKELIEQLNQLPENIKDSIVYMDAVSADYVENYGPLISADKVAITSYKNYDLLGDNVIVVII